MQNCDVFHLICSFKTWFVLGIQSDLMKIF
jgi:hypothetical protein